MNICLIFDDHEGGDVEEYVVVVVVDDDYHGEDDVRMNGAKRKNEYMHSIRR